MSEPAEKQRTELACAVIENGRGQVLIARREAAGESSVWEFPAEAIQGDESPEEAVRRAAKDKVGLHIEIAIGQPPFDHEFADRIVTYRYFQSGVIGGQAEGLAYDEVRWIEKGQLREYHFDRPTQGVVNWLLEE